MEHVQMSTWLEAGVGIAMSFPATILAWKMFRGQFIPIAIGLILAFVGYYATFALGKWMAAIIFPSALFLVKDSIVAASAATDPVAVEALMKRLKGKTTTFFEALALVLTTESLFNDPISLWQFGVSRDQKEVALHSMLLAGYGIALLALITILVLVLTKGNRRLSSSIRKVASVILILIGIPMHAALITIGVAGNFICGTIEGFFSDHHHDHEDRLDSFGTVSSYIIVVVSFLLALMCASGSILYSFIGAGFMTLFRVAPSGGIGLLSSTVRAALFGRATAIGVITIGALTFYEVGAFEPSAVLAGAALVSILVFPFFTHREFTNASKQQIDPVV